MAYIVFDVETTDILPRNKPHPSVTKFYPHIVQIAWIRVDENGKIAKEFCATIQPNGFEIPKKSSEIHKITTEKALAEGQDLLTVLRRLEKDLRDTSYIIAHNAEFDSLVISAECYRLGIPDFFRDRKIHCTMKTTTDLCRLPGKYGFKYPKLIELHHFLFRKEPKNKKNLHNALEDAKVTQKCWEKLQRRYNGLEWRIECRKPKV